MMGDKNKDLETFNSQNILLTEKLAKMDEDMEA